MEKLEIEKENEFPEKIGLLDYERKYTKECSFIWNNMVPDYGQSNILQGEMLRMIYKLRLEAFNNGNINWDDNYSWFCDFLKNTLLNSEIFDISTADKITKILDFIKSNGNYAKKYQNGEIGDDEVDIFKLAYTRDDLYYFIEDAIALYYIKNTEEIPYEKKSFIYR